MPEAAALPVPVGGIDPQAYQDDLLRASDLIEGSEPVDAGYAASFLRSLGRAAGDDDLERAAAEAQTAPGRAALARMLQDRLRERNGALGRPVL